MAIYFEKMPSLCAGWLFCEDGYFQTQGAKKESGLSEVRSLFLINLFRLSINSRNLSTKISQTTDFRLVEKTNDVNIRIVLFGNMNIFRFIDFAGQKHCAKHDRYDKKH